jgi:hypothetical protein
MNEELTAAGLRPGVLEQVGGDMDVARERVIAAFQSRTQALCSMTAVSTKLSALLGSMRWQLLRFEEAVLAYSDQPVVRWRMGSNACTELPSAPTFGPLEALEIAVPVAPHLALLMTWADKPDAELPVKAPAEFAEGLNAMVTAQAAGQWMHKPGVEPVRAQGTIRPLSKRFERGYDSSVAQGTRRRAHASRAINKVRNRRFMNDSKVGLSRSASPGALNEVHSAAVRHRFGREAALGTAALRSAALRQKRQRGGTRSLVPVGELMNDAMRQRASQPSSTSGLARSLQMLVDAGFVERDGCVFLATEAHSAPEGELLDQTGREALVNHIHVEDRLSQRDGADLVAQALQYARALAERLASAFPLYAFDVVLAVGDASTVRFYRRRAHEPPWISADLEGYRDEAVLVLRVE